MRIQVLTILILLITVFCDAQSTVYGFNATTSITTEANTIVIAGYVKAAQRCMASDSVLVTFKSGNPILSHIDTSSFVVRFSIGMDSAPFMIRIYDDTFPEHPDSIRYVIQNYGSSASAGTDSTLLFIVNDDDLPATIRYTYDSASSYEAGDSFYKGVFIPIGATYNVSITVDNPNPFYVRYIADNLDYWRHDTFSNIDAYAIQNFYYNEETLYAAPGVNTYLKTVYFVNTNMSQEKHFYCILRNIDANLITDSLTFFTIKGSDFFNTPSVSFDTNLINIVSDTLSDFVIPITIRNPNVKPLYFRIDTLSSGSKYPGINYTYNNQPYGYGNGVSHDTFRVHFANPHLPGDTISIYFALRNDTVNGSFDTLLHVTIIDTGGVNISFLGAGFAHLKSDSIGYVSLYTSTIANFPISARVKYINGNATPGVDFIFHDTTVVFPPNAYDTISLQIIILKDHLRQGNEQINLSLTNVQPTNVIADIVQYTYTIIDDDSTAVSPNGIQVDKPESLSIYPDPFRDIINIQTILPDYTISIANPLGENVYDQNHKKGNSTIDLKQLPCGWYVVSVYDGQTTYRSILIKD